MHVDLWPLDRIRPYEHNPRLNDQAVDAVADSIREFGFRQPIVVDADGVIIAGHTRYKAARLLGLDEVPVHVAAGLSPEQVRAYRLADNTTGEQAEWDFELLPIELSELVAADYDVDLTGFDSETLTRLLTESEVDDEGPSGDATGTDPGEDRYREQYGVIVMCEDEAEQQRVYETLHADGYACRVVCT
jgi:ParB-like chromosome segregation protein Spo0J